MSDIENSEELAARFEELSVLEAEFEEKEREIIRQAEAIHAPYYTKRADFIAKIPHFWPLVFEQAPPELDSFIQPSDAKLFAECFETFHVSRFELDDPNGSPRSFSLQFGFKENEYFEDRTLEKKFWYRRTKDWAGLVSEPVKIRWKAGHDLTGGLTDAAYALGEARKKITVDTWGGAARREEIQLPEHRALARAIDESPNASTSLFGLFAFVSGFRYVSAQESQRVEREEKEKVEKIKRGERVEEEEGEEEDTQDDLDVEVFPGGDEIVTILAEELWPNAIKYYKATFDEDDDGDDGDEDLSDMDLTDDGAMKGDGDNDPDDQASSDSDASEVDIRALVGKGRQPERPPPTKKQRRR